MSPMTKFTVYNAPNEEIVREHAKLGGFRKRNQ
jgi:hypothetical protein